MSHTHTHMQTVQQSGNAPVPAVHIRTRRSIRFPLSRSLQRHKAIVRLLFNLLTKDLASAFCASHFHTPISSCDNWGTHKKHIYKILIVVQKKPLTQSILCR